LPGGNRRKQPKVNGVNAIEGRARLRGIKEGVLMAGELWHEGGIPMLNARWHGVAGGGEMRWQRDRDRSTWGRGQN
jgi:hypothetical protein